MYDCASSGSPVIVLVDAGGFGGWVSVSNNAENQIASPFTPLGQQRNRNDYSQFGVF